MAKSDVEVVEVRFNKKVKAELEAVAATLNITLEQYITFWAYNGYHINHAATESSRLQLTSFKSGKPGDVLKYMIDPGVEPVETPTEGADE